MKFIRTNQEKHNVAHRAPKSSFFATKFTVKPFRLVTDGLGGLFRLLRIPERREGPGSGFEGIIARQRQNWTHTFALFIVVWPQSHWLLRSIVPLLHLSRVHRHLVRSHSIHIMAEDDDLPLRRSRRSTAGNRHAYVEFWRWLYI